MKYNVKENRLSKVELFLLRRVSWEDILEGLDAGIRWAERRYEKYKEKRSNMDFKKYNGMVMGSLMDHIHSDLIKYDNNSIDYEFYQQITSYLSELFLDVIKGSYNKIAD